MAEENESTALVNDSDVQTLDTNDHNSHYHHCTSGIHTEQGDTETSFRFNHNLSPSGLEVQSLQILSDPPEDCLSLDSADSHVWQVGYRSTELCQTLTPSCDYHDQKCSNRPTQVEENGVVADLQHQYIGNIRRPQDIMQPHGPHNHPQNPQGFLPDDLLDSSPRRKSSNSFERSIHQPPLVSIAPAPYPRVDYHHPTHSESAGDNVLHKDARDKFLISSKLSGMSYKEIKSRGHFREAESTLRGRFRTLTKAPEQRLRKPVWTAQDVSIIISELWSNLRMYHKYSFLLFRKKGKQTSDIKAALGTSPPPSRPRNHT